MSEKSGPLSGTRVPEANFSEKGKNGKIFRETCSRLMGRWRQVLEAVRLLNGGTVGGNRHLLAQPRFVPGL